MKNIQANEEGYVYLGFFPNRPYYDDLANNTYYIQVELGTEASPFEPYVDTSEELAKRLSDINEFLRVNL